MAHSSGMMPFGEHLDALRKVLMRILLITFIMAVVAFVFKDKVFAVIMAPLKPDFITFEWLRGVLAAMDTGLDVSGTPQLIATDISSQFMAHISMSLYVGLLLASPYIGYALLGYVLPALYDNERHYASRLCVTVYALFIAGLMLSYFVMFPISCRFLTTYSVSPQVTTMVDISSYLSLFISLSLLLGAVFQLPVGAYFLAKIGIINSRMLRNYRRHAIIGTAVVAAIITPPDALSLILVALPLYALYEVSIPIVARVSKHSSANNIPSTPTTTTSTPQHNG